MKNLARKMFLLIGFVLVGSAVAPAVADAQPYYHHRHYRHYHHRPYRHGYYHR